MNIFSVRAQNGQKSTLGQNIRFQEPVLYHASPVNDLTLIVPSSKTTRSEDEGPVIFATPDFSYASQFLFRWDDSWVIGGVLNNVHVVIICGKKRFKKADGGGTIYELACDNFTCNIKKFGHDKEWVSTTEVKVKQSHYFESALEAMMSLSVQVYFVDKKIFERIKKAKDFGVSILRTTMSENMKLGKNVRFI